MCKVSIFKNCTSRNYTKLLFQQLFLYNTVKFYLLWSPRYRSAFLGCLETTRSLVQCRAGKLRLSDYAQALTLPRPWLCPGLDNVQALTMLRPWLCPGLDYAQALTMLRTWLCPGLDCAQALTMLSNNLRSWCEDKHNRTLLTVIL